MENKIPKCRICDELSRCGDYIEACLAIQVFFLGAALVWHPTLMIESRAWSNLLTLLPQPAWALIFLSMSLSKVISATVGWFWVRVFSLALGAGVFAEIAWVTSTPALPTFSPWIYGPLAFIHIVALTAVCWQRGRDWR